MIYTRPTLITLEGLDLRHSRSLVPFLPARGEWGIVSPGQFDADDDAIFRRLLIGDASGMEDALARYLASIRSEQRPPFDASLAAIFAQLGARPTAGTVIPEDAARRLLPLLVDRREGRPIVLRGGASKPMPLALPIKATESLATPTESDDTGAAGLSLALAACVRDDVASARRRRISARKPLWAVAAALGTIAIVPSIAMHWSPSAAPVTVAVSTPIEAERAAQAQLAFAAAAGPIRVVERVPSVEHSPVPERRVTAAIIAPAIVDAVDKLEAPSKTAFVPTHDILPPPPAILSPAPIAATHATVSIAATRAVPGVARGAKRKARKALSAKSTTVASALTLPDVLKPQ